MKRLSILLVVVLCGVCFRQPADGRTRVPNAMRSGHHYGESAGRTWGLEGKRFPSVNTIEIEAIRAADGVDCPPHMRERFVKGYIAGFVMGWPKGIVECSAERRARLAWESLPSNNETVVVSESAEPR